MRKIFICLLCSAMPLVAKPYAEKYKDKSLGDVVVWYTQKGKRVTAKFLDQREGKVYVVKGTRMLGLDRKMLHADTLAWLDKERAKGYQKVDAQRGERGKVYLENSVSKYEMVLDFKVTGYEEKTVGAKVRAQIGNLSDYDYKRNHELHYESVGHALNVFIVWWEKNKFLERTGLPKKATLTDHTKHLVRSMGLKDYGMQHNVSGKNFSGMFRLRNSIQSYLRSLKTTMAFKYQMVEDCSIESLYRHTRGYNAVLLSMYLVSDRSEAESIYLTVPVKSVDHKGNIVFSAWGKEFKGKLVADKEAQKKGHHGKTLPKANKNLTPFYYNLTVSNTKSFPDGYKKAKYKMVVSSADNACMIVIKPLFPSR